MKGEAEITGSARPLVTFLCHSSTDKPNVRGLHQRLLNAGIKPWLDEEDLLPGQKWEQEIPNAVRNSDVVIVCISHASRTRAGYVQKEIKYALDVAEEQPEGTIFIIPLRLEDCEVPQRLRPYQWVNYFEERGYKQLMKALQVRAEQVGASAPEAVEELRDEPSEHDREAASPRQILEEYREAAPNEEEHHPTHHSWRPDVRAVVEYIESRFSTAANTYNDHPVGWGLDNVSVDFWGLGGRGDPIDPNVGQEIVEFLFNDPNLLWFRWLIWQGWIWEHTLGWQPYDDPFDMHFDHVHLTFW
jgi:hypothetical protein